MVITVIPFQVVRASMILSFGKDSIRSVVLAINLYVGRLAVVRLIFGIIFE